MSEVLFELGVEELPSGAVLKLAKSLADNLAKELESAQIKFNIINYFATPRRLAVSLTEIEESQPNQFISKKGPSTKIGTDAKGQPSKALAGFARSCGTTVTKLIKKVTDKGEFFFFEEEVAGSKTKELLPELIQNALDALPIAKLMRWGEGEFEFVRPAHWCLLLLDGEVVKASFFGVEASNKSYGHRFHHPEAITINSVSEYETKLLAAKVIASFTKRREVIETGIKKLAGKMRPLIPESLLYEVTSIVEWPQPLMVPFDKEFLDVPKEALIASMQSHQKCFALEDKNNELEPCFITVANIESKNAKDVIAGNEKVMRARLSDAAYFYNQDKKHSLASLREISERVIYQKGLGSLQAKSDRVLLLVKELAMQIGIDVAQAERAAFLSKCDLMSGMVGEFPELQGLMGYYYALNDGEDESVAIALNEQYMPRFAADVLPATKLGMILSLADRIDTLVGCFAIGARPTGMKDPFKLRRHALAVVRMLISKNVNFNLSTLIKLAIDTYGNTVKVADDTGDVLKRFIFERLISFYQGQGIAQDIVKAASARQQDWLFDLDKRIKALVEFNKMEEATSLSSACKRVNNILSKVDASEISDVNQKILIDAQEIRMHADIEKTAGNINKLIAEAKYVEVLRMLAELRDSIDTFFENIMVMVDDKALRQNRIALLVNMQNVLQSVADIGKLD